VSDFLSRLAERSTGTPPALRPRVPSTFEPWSAGDLGADPRAAAAWPSAAQPTNAAASPPAATARPTREPPRASVTPPAPASPPAPAPPLDSDDRHPAAPRPRTPAPAPAPISAAAAAAEPSADAPPPPAPAPAPRHHAPDLSPEPLGPTRPTPAVAAPPRQPRRQGSAPPVPETAAPAAAEAPLAARAASRAPRDDAVAEPWHAFEPPAGPPANVVQRGRARAGPAPTPGRAGDGPLTVEVTIGRVEVRAAPAPPARAGRRPAPGPRVTLDEYLAERTRAGRR
jgi:hypothetical protein